MSATTWAVLPRPPAKRLTDDDRARDDIVRELAWDSRIAATDVEVEVTAGVVRLAGCVGTYAEKLAAQDAAFEVENIHDVVNDIDVTPRHVHQLTDKDLKAIVHQVLEWDVLVPADRISIAVADGRISLSGSVTVARQREEAEHAVRHLPGVRSVTNQIEVGETRVSPSDVREALTDALERRARHLAGRLDVSVDRGQVTLAGTVASERQKQAVLGAVTHAPGVEVVCDDLTIDSGS